MKLIPIYSAEASVEGLAEKIRANSSIAYCAPVSKGTFDQNTDIEKVLANLVRQTAYANMTVQDLYPTQSILATTSWNRNDDIFSLEDTWAARHTPINKPTNIGHVEAELVGHMTGTWCIDASGKVIDDDTLMDELPDMFHLCNSAVIYAHWQDEALKTRTADLIQQIEAGTKYVSMECFFSNFDYGVKSSSGEFHVVKRDKSSAFLTKHLRAYGGKGVYDGFTLGRVMRGFVFSGKGYVDVPANPESIIFTDASTLNFSQASEENPFDKTAGVSLSYKGILNACAQHEVQETEQTIMSAELDILKTELSEIKAALKNSETARAELAEKLSKADVAKYETQIAELTAKVEAAAKSKEEDKKAADKAKAELEATSAKLAEVEKAKAELDVVLAKAAADKALATRISILTDGGIEKTEAEKKVNLFANLNDEQFTAVASELVEAAKAKKSEDSPEDKKKKEEKAKADADAAALANAKPIEEVIPVVASTSDDTKVNETRVAIASLISPKYKKSE
jgi:hypothetical protein